ncbi:MAG TPA: hypothetical protein VGR35_05075 [Tepidisphaeraceae bacterium]|nr:hypothetical protein [Tepidisphaeraceae bacterium]
MTIEQTRRERDPGWQDFEFVSQTERLVRLALMIGFAIAAGECYKRARGSGRRGG